MENIGESCPKCNVEMEYRQIGQTQGLFCIQCDWCVVTSYFSDLELDSTVYKVFNKDKIEANISQIKVISKIANTNYLTAKKMLASNNCLIIEGKAQRICDGLALLSEHNIAYFIEPEYPHLQNQDKRPL